MRRILVGVIAVFLILSAKVVADDEIINFPDPYFKKVLVNMKYVGYAKVDLNEDGEIQYSEAAAYDDWLRLDCEYADSITDLTGIKAFINLKKILFERNPLINEIDLSGMVNLEEINFNNNWNLEVLNASGCINLGLINCNDSKIKYLNSENCSKINRITCLNNSMEEIDLTECRNLQLLTSTNGHLSKLDFSDCLRLEGLRISNNQLTELDLSYLTKLEGITCDNNKLKKLEISNSPNFVRLDANNNQLESINVRNGNNKLITKFKTFGNPDLKCITVDDPTYSKENWKDIDEWTEFSEDCSNGVNDNPQNQFKVFPNPANNTVLIERVGIEAADLRIVDITGRICLSHSIHYGVTQIRLDISKFTAGKYIIELNNEMESLIVE